LGLFFDSNIVISFSEIKLAEEHGSNSIFQDHGDVGEGADIFDHDRIDFLIVKQGSETTVFLLIIEDRGAVRGI